MSTFVLGWKKKNLAYLFHYSDLSHTFSSKFQARIFQLYS